MTWKIKIKGNSMAGLFPDGKVLCVKVQANFIPESDLQVGRIVILKKRKPDFSSQNLRSQNSQNHLRSHNGSVICQEDRRGKGVPGDLEGHALIIHRIVGKFCFADRLSFWEKGDNDCFPKACYPDDILAIVTGIEGHPEFSAKLQPGLWQGQNRKLLKFYKMLGRIYALGVGSRGSQRQGGEKRGIFYKVWQKGFWSILYLLCSFFDLKGQ